MYGEKFLTEFFLNKHWKIVVPGERLPLKLSLWLDYTGWKFLVYRGDESDVTGLLAARGIESKPFEQIPSRRLCDEFDYAADPGEIATKAQSVMDALRQPPSAPV